MNINRYISFSIAVFILVTVPSVLMGGSNSNELKNQPVWNIDIRIREKGIEVMCGSGCYYKAASVECSLIADVCIVGVSQAGVGGGSGRTFVIENSHFEKPDS